MKRAITITAVVVAVFTVYMGFFHVRVCVSAAANRIAIPSSIGVCPPYVESSIEEINGQFKKRVAVGDGPEDIENALAEMGVSFSWDRFQQRYGGIIRHPRSKFHAITVDVYVDEQRKYKSIEVNDSFTAL